MKVPLYYELEYLAKYGCTQSTGLGVEENSNWGYSKMGKWSCERCLVHSLKFIEY